MNAELIAGQDSLWKTELFYSCGVAIARPVQLTLGQLEEIKFSPPLSLSAVDSTIFIKVFAMFVSFSIREGHSILSKFVWIQLKNSFDFHVISITYPESFLIVTIRFKSQHAC